MHQTLYVILSDDPHTEHAFPVGDPALEKLSPIQAIDSVGSTSRFAGRPAKGAWVLESDEQESVRAVWGQIPIPIELRCTAATVRLRRVD